MREKNYLTRSREHGAAARNDGERGPRKVPEAFAEAKVPSPVGEGRQLFGEEIING